MRNGPLYRRTQCVAFMRRASRQFLERRTTESLTTLFESSAEQNTNPRFHAHGPVDRMRIGPGPHRIGACPALDRLARGQSGPDSDESGRVGCAVAKFCHARTERSSPIPHSSDGARKNTRRHTTDGLPATTGRFTVGKLTSGDYTLIVTTRDGSELIQQPIGAGARDVVITLAGADRIGVEPVAFGNASTITGTVLYDGHAFEAEVDGQRFARAVSLARHVCTNGDCCS